MAVSNWIGGTTAVAQVKTLIVEGSWAADNTIRTTLTSGDGSTTQAVTSTATSSTMSTGVIDPHISDLQASTQSLFSAVTWVKSGSTLVQGTAKIAGVPFSSTGALNIQKSTPFFLFIPFILYLILSIINLLYLYL